MDVDIQGKENYKTSKGPERHGGTIHCWYCFLLFQDWNTEYKDLGYVDAQFKSSFRSGATAHDLVIICYQNSESKLS